MAGFFSWISAIFSPSKSATVHPTPRLLNPAIRQVDDQPENPVSTRQLEEQLFSWLLDAPPAALAGDLNSAELEALDTLENRIHKQSLEEMPRRPMTLPMLSRALSDDKVDRKELARIILSDPALTDQLLHVANSPLFRGSHKAIDSVDQAVFILGVGGIRNVISAAIMRPMMAARNSREALFAQRVWRWGLTCAKAAELVARLREKDGSLFFMTGLLPALSYITLRRELQRICRSAPQPGEPSAILTYHALSRFQWATAQVLANEWNLSPEYHAKLMEAERPGPNQSVAPLNDGIIMGTREILRHAHQRNMAEEEVLKLVHIAPEEFTRIRRVILDSIEAGARARA
jgi:HD-like signal output (HDOD) protein